MAHSSEPLGRNQYFIQYYCSKSSIYCNNNENIDPTDPNRGNLFKIRPLIDYLQEKFGAIPKRMPVDEQVQYNPKKTKKWEFKVFVIRGTTGLVYDLKIYQGAIQSFLGFQNIGAGSNIVLKMFESVFRGMNYKLFFGNWFSSLSFSFKLKEVGIESPGTVRIYRFTGTDFLSDKQMLKEQGRRSIIAKSHIHEETEEIRVINWMDNRGVVLMSTFEVPTRSQLLQNMTKSRPRKYRCSIQRQGT